MAKQPKTVFRPTVHPGKLSLIADGVHLRGGTPSATVLVGAKEKEVRLRPTGRPSNAPAGGPLPPATARPTPGDGPIPPAALACPGP